MEHSAFLERIKARLSSGAHPSISHPMKAVAGVPAVRYARSLDDPAESFVKAATTAGTEVQRCENTGALEDLLARVLEGTEVGSAVLSRDPEVELVRRALEQAGIRCDAPPAEADLGVVGAAYGIAATGTVVFDSGRAGTRTASLLPPALLVVLPSSSIVPTAGDILRRTDERFPEGLPSQLVMATGPSRSADIEQELTVGVHGPGRVWVAIVQEGDHA